MFGRKQNQGPTKYQINEQIKQLERQYKKTYEQYLEEIDEYKGQHSQKWEYKEAVDVNAERLQLLGQRGWELVAVSSYALTTQQATVLNHGSVNTVYLRYTFKRPAISVPSEINEQILSRFGQLQTLRADIELLQKQLENS